uniref:Rho-GAP domain-containing protein n=1 Tax=Syphacia muris TaxID=451379 RepID=A0A0N5AD48_9BILA
LQYFRVCTNAVRYQVITDEIRSILSELGEYFRRRAEIDNEYGKQLDKLAKSTMQRHKNDKNKRESWPLHSSCALWQQLVDATKEEARERKALSELYSSHFTSLIAQRSEDLMKISRKCREIGILAHGEITRVLNELHTAMKTYQLCYAQCAGVEAKYKQAEANKIKYEEENPSKLGSTRKHRVLVKMLDKRFEKYKIVKVKCLKARNEYLLCVGAANAALHKYFADDLSDLIDCADLGMEQWEKALISCAISARKAICQREMDSLAELCEFNDSLDAKADKQKFFEANYTTFMLPRPFEFSHYLLNSNLIERLEARSNGILNALNEYNLKNSLDGGVDNPSSGECENVCMRTRRKKRIGSGTTSCEVVRRPRLFGGSLDEYVEITGEAIPLLITSSIRRYSFLLELLQSIFRISGSQIEINAFKEAFEKGEDPLRDVVDASDVNSVAGVLKLYLRELREPLFPIFLFDQLTKCAECLTIVPLLQKLSQPTLLVLRYLFAFLNHLSEFSDENMMDPYNLAICFGPTLLPIPEGKDQVFYHNFVNELVKNLILYHDLVFPQSLAGPRYEKYLVETDHALFIDEPLIWSKRAAGASSLREQLHHTRNKNVKDGINGKR